MAVSHLSSSRRTVNLPLLKLEERHMTKNRTFRHGDLRSPAINGRYMPTGTRMHAFSKQNGQQIEYFGPVSDYGMI